MRVVLLVVLACLLAAEDQTVITVGAASGTVIPSTLLGTHLGYTFRAADWDGSAAKRFPACGWGEGALFRHFVANSGPRTVKRDGHEVTIPARDWWGHIQADERARGDGDDADYRWMQIDIWQDLDYVERLGGENLIVTSGFPELTKETAAALVAFCNGMPEDTHAIGVDRLGTDWKTVGHWAAIRAHGDARHPAHPAPYRVRWWEVGNELYDPKGGPPGSWLRIADYANQGAGRDNAARAGYFMNGRNVDGIAYDGFLAFAAAMKAVDPAIRVGAMLAPEHKGPWHGEWNRVVLEHGRPALDFASFHPYGRSKGLAPERIVEQPREDVAVFVDALRARLRGAGYQDGFPLIASEWSAYEPSDPGLTRMPTALFAADTLGLLASRGIAGACFYSAYDTIRPDGSWAAMVRVAESQRAHLPPGHRWPSYFSFALWRRLEGALAEARVEGPCAGSLDAWATRSPARITVLLVDRRAAMTPARLVIPGISSGRYRVDAVAPAGGALMDADVVFNHMPMSSPEGEAIDDLGAIPPLADGAMTSDGIPLDIPAWGIAVVTVEGF